LRNLALVEGKAVGLEEMAQALSMEMVEEDKAGRMELHVLRSSLN
jgi:hypothetical protein